MTVVQIAIVVREREVQQAAADGHVEGGLDVLAVLKRHVRDDWCAVRDERQTLMIADSADRRVN